MDFSSAFAAASDVLTTAATAHIQNTNTFLVYMDQLLQPWMNEEDCKESTPANVKNQSMSTVAPATNVPTHSFSTKTDLKLLNHTTATDCRDISVEAKLPLS